MWIDFLKTSIYPHYAVVYMAVFGLGNIDAEKFNNAVKEIKDHIKTLNIHLQGKTHLVANRITVADIAIAMNLIPLY